MELNELTALSPIDGRYRSKTQILSPFFSENALIKYRVRVEVDYFIALTQLPLPQLKSFDPASIADLEKIVADFDLKAAQAVKAFEQTTNHDVKAVEYFLKERFAALGLGEYKEFIHFGLTSQDINNTAIPLLLKDAMEQMIEPKLAEVNQKISSLGDQWKDVSMLARTHGQPASPTRLGKELQVFHERVKHQLHALKQIPYSAKFGGATGNLNAHQVAYPDVDWLVFAQSFIEGLGLQRSHPTTQIEHYDHLAALFDNLKRINTILIDLSRDIWQYISMNYFTQKIKKDEVGSSAMPHKVNPIDFENAEGNLGLANALYQRLSAKLPISRLQRDLSDSTVMRNIGVGIAHSYLAFESLLKGLGKIQLNEVALKTDLEFNWAVVAEAIQTILRREGYPKPYEALKELTRTNEHITQESITAFVGTLEVSDTVKEELLRITPYNYTGI
ncbi:MAG: adenylosuccinate lyase [Cyclobacteriaceae bacterium]